MTMFRRESSVTIEYEPKRFTRLKERKPLCHYPEFFSDPIPCKAYALFSLISIFEILDFSSLNNYISLHVPYAHKKYLWAEGTMKSYHRSNKQPLVSIVMPVYNAGRYLREAINSILHQTYPRYEFYLVDDRSTDNSWQIIKGYKKLYPKKIKAVRLKKNTNSAGNGAVNAVYTQLKGKYIARMDADDIAMPDRIEKQVAFMEEHPLAILCGTQGLVIDEKGFVTGDKIFPTEAEDIYKEYFVLHPILHPSVMFRKSRIPHRNHLYEEKYGINDDYYTFFELLQYGQFYNLNEYLLQYRLHGKNSSLMNPKAKFITSLIIRIQAVLRFYYKPSLRGIILMLCQIPLVLLLPEKYIVPLYSFIRGMNRPAGPSYKYRLAISK